jgi:hypothetical protein
MRAALKKRTRSSRALERYIDPTVPVTESVGIVLTSLRAAGFGPEPESPELRHARRGVLALLRTARWLNGLPFWESVTIPRAPKSWAPESVQEQRSELLAGAREHLQGGAATRADILAAMDTCNEVVANMTTIFAAGRVVGMDEPQEAWATDRYTCAALLPALAEQLNNFWTQLHKTTDYQSLNV